LVLSTKINPYCFQMFWAQMAPAAHDTMEMAP